MHPESLFSSVVSRKFLPLFIIFVVFFAGIFFIISSPLGRVIKKEQTNKDVLTPTPIPVHFEAQTYTGKQYSLSYPSSWKNNIPANPQSDIKSFTFTVNGKQYHFADNPPEGQNLGEAGSEGIDTIISTTTVYGGRNFVRAMWYRKGVPIFIQAIPNEVGFKFDVFSMELPPDNSQEYINLFDQILSKLQFSGNLKPPLTPVPTIQGGQTLYLSR